MNMNLSSFNTPAYFQLQNGQLDVQAKQLIQQFDTDLDGSLSQIEIAKSPGLLGTVKGKVNSPQLAQALWASIAGPSNTINAKEYSTFLLRLDADRNGVITQAESDAYISRDAQTFQNMGVQEGVRSIYTTLVSGGNQLGLGQVFGTTQEEQFALAYTPQALQSSGRSLPPSSLVNPTTQLTDLLTEAPDAPTGAELKVQLIGQAQLQIANTIGALFTLAADFDPRSPSYAKTMAKLNELQAIESSLKKQEGIASILPQQINSELSKQGITIKRSQELVELSEQGGAMLSLVAKEVPESPRYNTLMTQVSQIASQEYKLFKKLNPDYVRVVQEVSNKNKADILSGKINAQNLPKVEYTEVNVEPLPITLENIQKGKDFSFQLVLVRQAKEQMSKTIKSLFELVKDLPEGSPTYQALISRLNGVQQIEKTLTLQEIRLQQDLKGREQPFTEPSPEMVKYLELAKTVQPEDSEYKKIMAKVQELANTHYNLDGSNPSPLPTASTNDLSSILVK